MAHSFVGDYRLCEAHYKIVQLLGAIDYVQPKTKRYEERTTVLGKTLAYLRAVEPPKPSLMRPTLPSPDRAR